MLQQENTHPNQQVVTIKGNSDAGQESRTKTVFFEEPTDADEITDEVLQLWLRRCRRKFLQGTTVIKVANNGKLVKRQLYIGAKPEYLELISSKLFDTAYHLSSISSIKCTLDSPDFKAFRELQPGCMPKLEKTLVMHVGGRPLSIVFQSVSDRRDAQMYLLAQQKMLEKQGENEWREYELKKTLPAMKTQREIQWTGD